MILNFNLEDIKYLKMQYEHNGSKHDVKLCLVEKLEEEFVALLNQDSLEDFDLPMQISVGFVSVDGLYTTTSELISVESSEDGFLLHIKNPKSLDYHQNREYYRVIYKQDCIYTVHNDYETNSYNAETYDISEKGVSIILDDNIVTKDECLLTIMSKDFDIRSYVKFVRSDIYEDDYYKLSFEFMDLSEKDKACIRKICAEAQQF